MRALRACLGLALATMVVAVWQRREPVIRAYTDERPPVQFEFDGLDFELGSGADLGPSPLFVPQAPDTKAVVLPTLQAATVEPESALPIGDVDLAGTVSNEFGPVPFATVRVEYHRAPAASSSASSRSTSVTSIDVLADEAGQWELTGVGGGRWRIRAFLPDQLASVSPVVRFVSAGSSVVIDLAVSSPDPAPVLAVASPPNRFLGETALVAFTVGRHRVDTDGIIVIDPVPGVVVDMSLGVSVLRPVSALTAITDRAGVARFGGACDVAGPSQATFSAVVDSGLGSVGVTSAITSPLTECVPVPPPDTADASPDGTAPGATDG